MKLILKYFDIAGRGEVLRILLGGCKDVQYVDTRIPFSEWKTVKPTLPLGTLPVLIKDDNIVMTQSTSLYRYVAKLVTCQTVSEMTRRGGTDDTDVQRNDRMRSDL
jgi:glutathione S-transferase